MIKYDYNIDDDTDDIFTSNSNGLSDDNHLEDGGIDSDYVYNVLKDIVTREHTDPAKQHVHRKDEGGFKIACPYCGDSQKNASNYRGNFNSLLFYTCFNGDCGIKTHFTSFCKYFKYEMDAKHKKDLYTYLERSASRLENIQEAFLQNGIEKIIDLSVLADVINNKKSKAFSKLSDFMPIVNGSVQFWYLHESRGIPTNMYKNIYQCDYNITSSWTEKCIVYLNVVGDKILGMQLRNLKSGNKRVFRVFTFDELYRMVHGDTDDLSDGEIIMYNKLSYLYGILNLNFEKPITIFEGYGDALLFPNSVSGSGVNTDFSFLESNGLDIRYFFDNDKDGYLKTAEKMKMGIPCFLWQKLFDDIIVQRGLRDPSRVKTELNETISDLTKLNKMIPNSVTELHLLDYFSRDKFDIKYIPYVKPKFRKFNEKKKNINI